MVVVVWYPLQGYLHVWGCLILSETDIIIFISLLSKMNWLPERCCLMSDSWKWRRQVMILGSLCYSEKAMTPQPSILAWKIPWMEEPGRLQSTGSLRVGHDWATSLSLFTLMHWRRKWQPTPVFLPGESQGWGSLVDCCLWGHTELDTIEVT